MAKKTNTKKKLKVLVKVPKRPSAKTTRQAFGPVTTMNTAPVAIGNSVRGVRNSIQNIQNGIRVVGRDYMFSLLGTNAISTWCLRGGTPLTPAAFADSVIANHMRTYAKFKFRSVVIHFITSSPTSATGDIVTYYNKNRDAVMLDQTSANLLPFLLSDPSSVLGPQWLNHSTKIEVTGDWKSTDYGMHSGLTEFSDGDIFLLSKAVATDAPGYVLFDYVIDFAERQLQPRLLVYPIPKIQWHQTNLLISAQAVTAGTTTTATASKIPVLGGNDLTGSAATLPTGNLNGDLYKVFLDITNSDSGSWTNCTTTNLFRTTVIIGTGFAFTVQDGTTLYASYSGASNYTFYATAEEAYAQVSPILYGVTATITYNLQVWMSYIGSFSSTNLNPSF